MNTQDEMVDLDARKPVRVVFRPFGVRYWTDTADAVRTIVVGQLAMRDGLVAPDAFEPRKVQFDSLYGVTS